MSFYNPLFTSVVYQRNGKEYKTANNQRKINRHNVIPSIKILMRNELFEFTTDRQKSVD